jgi:hypothetical protein
MIQIGRCLITKRSDHIAIIVVFTDTAQPCTNQLIALRSLLDENCNAKTYEHIREHNPTDPLYPPRHD